MFTVKIDWTENRDIHNEEELRELLPENIFKIYKNELYYDLLERVVEWEEDRKEDILTYEELVETIKFQG